MLQVQKLISQNFYFFFKAEDKRSYWYRCLTWNGGKGPDNGCLLCLAAFKNKVAKKRQHSFTYQSQDKGLVFSSE